MSAQDLAQPGGRLCLFCQKLKRGKWIKYKNTKSSEHIQHHPTFASLCESATGGCTLCCLLKRGVVAYQNRGRDNRLPYGYGQEMDLRDDHSPRNIFVLYRKCTLVAPKFRIGERDTYYDGFVLSRGWLHDRKLKKEEFEFKFSRGPFFQHLAQTGKYDFLPQGLGPDLTLAADWLRDCNTNHPGCHRTGEDVYPSRVLQISASEDESQLEVRLVEADGVAKPYVALSHCWGTFQPLRTTSESYVAHTNGIPLEALPKSFQDAVTTTSALGVNRLWIDSLCIIQDVREDWERECPRMAAIYANALCTIAASDAANGSKGFLNNYDHTMKCKIGASGTIRYFPFGNNSMIDEQTLLSTRGWVLQERLLSSRIISFKSGRTQWQCKQHYRSDDIRIPYTSYREDVDILALHSSLGTQRTDMSGKKPAFWEGWRELVEAYSRCQLTQPTDKLPALSGLAQMFSNRNNDTYMAGIWRSDLCQSLIWTRPQAWYIDLKRGDPSVCTQAMAPRRSPSWSWMSIDGELSFRGFHGVREQLSFSSVEIQAKGLDPFGEVQGGTLSVNGYLKGFNPWDRKCSFGELSLDSFGDVRKYRTPEDGTKEIFVLLVGNEGRITVDLDVIDVDLANDYSDEDSSNMEDATIADGKSWKRPWYGIALERMTSETGQVFRRVGYVEGKDTNENEWFNDCVRQDLKLV